MQNFAGKVALITGAAGGIGLSIARSFAEVGINTVIADIADDRLFAAASALSAQGLPVSTAHLDVTQRSDWETVTRDIKNRFGGIDILCNNAGIIGALQPLADTPAERIRRLLDINVMGAIHGIQCVVPFMRKRGGGHIVNTASMTGLDSAPLIADYCASKHALIGLSECLRDEVSVDGIHVSVLCAGAVATDIAKNTDAQLGDNAAARLTATTARANDALDPAAIGPMVLHAIANRQFYIFTHASSKVRIAARNDRIQRALDLLE